MAIAQIQTPQQQANPLQAILAGQSTITNFLNNAFQASRDNVNNQYRQDQALVQNMQLAQGLSQRRAQDLDARMTDRRNFAYREDQDKIQLGLKQDQLALQREQNMFNNEQAIGRMNLAGNADQRAERALTNQEEQLRREQEFLRNAATVPTVEGTPMPPTIESLPATPVNMDVAVATPSRVDLETRKAQLQTGIQAATRLKDANLLRQNQAELAQVNGQLAEIPKPPSRSDQRADTSLAMSQQNAQAKKITEQNKVDLADLKAFAPPDTGIRNKLISAVAGGKSQEAAFAELSPEEKSLYEEGSAVTNKDGTPNNAARLQRELLKIQNHTEQSYVDAGGSNLTQQEKDRRRDFYRRNSGTAAPSGNSVPSSGFNILTEGLNF